VKTGIENLGGNQTNCTSEGREPETSLRPGPGADLRSAAAAGAGSGAKGMQAFAPRTAAAVALAPSRAGLPRLPFSSASPAVELFSAPACGLT